MTTMSANGRGERKSLAGQIDRLDQILDGLADGLNGAVAEAVKLVVPVAVEAAVRELLTNAELQQCLRPEPVARPGRIRWATTMLCRGLVSAAKGCWTWLTAVVERGRGTATEAVATLQENGQVLSVRVRRGMTAFSRRVWLAGSVAAGLVRRFRKPLVVALASGIVIGLGCYLAGPAVASTVSGLAGFTASLAASVMGRLRQVLRRAALQEWYVGRLP